MCLSLFLLMLCFLNQYIAQSSSYIEYGCYFVDGEKFGCMKATVYSCDREWFFQFTTPIGEQGTGTYVMADGIIPIGYDFFQCYNMENGCEFCLSFFDTIETNGGNGIKVNSSISIECGDGVVQSYELGEFSASGPNCGENGYYYLPCPTSSQRSFYAPISAETVNNIIEEYSVNNLDELLYFDDGCYWIEAADEELGPFICPTILYDSCSLSEVILSSAAGLTFKIRSFVDDKSCTEFGNEISFCITPNYYEFERNTVETSLTFTWENTNGYVYYTLPERYFFFEYPACGESHLTCFDYFFDSSFSSNNFSSDWFSFFMSIIGISSSEYETYSSFWFFSSEMEFSSSTPSTTSWDHRTPSGDRWTASSSSDENPNVALGVSFASIAIIGFLVVAIIVAVVVAKKKISSGQETGAETVYAAMLQNE